RELPPVDARRWLLRLVYSKCMDIHRDRRRCPSIAGEEDLLSPRKEIEAAGPDHESPLLTRELIAVVRNRVQNLPPRLRKVAELYLLREMPYREIADLLALTEVNVRKRMQEARPLLREHLQAYREGGVQIQAPPPAAEAGGGLASAEPEPLRSSAWTLE